MPERRLPQDELIRGMFSRVHSVKVWGALVVRAVDPPEVFRYTDLVSELKEVPTSGIAVELRRLREFGMIKPAPLEHWPGAPGTWNLRASIYLERTDSPLWDIAEIAVKTFAEMFPQDETS
jgi:hypothetical protein